ncbi:MAG: hypothetical protein AB7K68_14225 [Bacteriovoracia bacterium]
MNCNYDVKAWERWLTSLLVPIAIAALTYVGTTTANQIATDKNKSDSDISKNHDKAAMIKEFLPILMSGKAADKVIAKIALEPYLSEQEWSQIDFAVRSMLDEDLVKSVQTKDDALGTATINAYQTLYPQAFKRLKEGTYIENQDSKPRALLDEKLKQKDTQIFFDSLIKRGTVRSNLDGKGSN